MSLQFSAQGYGDAYFHQFKDPPAYGEVIYAKRRPTQWILDRGGISIELDHDP